MRHKVEILAIALSILLVIGIGTVWINADATETRQSFANGVGPFHGTVISQTEICTVSPAFLCDFQLPNPLQNDTVRLDNGTIIHATDLCQIQTNWPLIKLK